MSEDLIRLMCVCLLTWVSFRWSHKCFDGPESETGGTSGWQVNLFGDWEAICYTF